MEMDQVLKHYALNYEKSTALAFGNGLINNTWKVILYPDNHNLLVQRINTSVFKNPQDIALNIRMVADYLQKHNPGYLFIAPLKTIEGKEYFYSPDTGYIRIFNFLDQAGSIDVINHPKQAYEAAFQFGLFVKLLSGFDANKLHITISDFHNLTLRYNQFRKAQADGNPERIQNAQPLIQFLKSQFIIVKTYEDLKAHAQCKLRVTHHDTKISNVLFDNSQKGLCVIDLDTLMPGYFFSDVGDMMRTYLSPASEEESDYSKIKIREDVFEAILKGYLSSMNSELSEIEKRHLVYSGKFMIYMQALRFISDYIQNDIYYTPKYMDHNLVRAENQVCLLKEFINKEKVLEDITNDILKNN
ncbi:MAG TPA: aminoglycoside phosphotransferase family protein [Flavisolibacter sp.]|nr:aminoglycoside phosphotransferase family protein [Flavisolibacter sp.]